MKKLIPIFVILSMLLFQLIFQLILARSDSQTTDEAVHLSSGYTYLIKHDFRFNPEHPPIIKALAALPLLIIKPSIPLDNEYWQKADKFFEDHWFLTLQFSQKMFYQSGNNPDQLLFWGRLWPILMLMGLGMAIFMISKAIWGWPGSLVSFGLFIFDANFIGHGHLITTDVGAALGYLLSIYVFWRFLHQPNYKWVLLTGLMIGISLLIKFTLLILWPAMIILFIYFAWTQKISKSKISSILWKFLIILGLSWLIVWGAYGFNYQLPPASGHVYQDIRLVNQARIDWQNDGNMINLELNRNPKLENIINHIYPYLRYLLVPRDFWKGLIMTFSHAAGGHRVFLLGKLADKGFWYYFPIIFLVKTSLASLLLIFLAIKKQWRHQENSHQVNFFLIAAGIYFIIAMLSKANLGIRHIFPIFPLLYIIAGGIWPLTKKWQKIAVVVAFGWLFIEVIITYPSYIGYFNQLAGGSSYGYKIARDSNLNWGEDIKRIKNYIAKSIPEEPYVIYGWNGETALDYYGIDRQPSEALNPASKGYIIIDASALVNRDYQWLQHYRPIDQITPGIFVYRLD